MMRFVIAGLVGVLLLAGCSSNAMTKTGTGNGGSLKTYDVDLPNGNTVLCVVYESGYAGGLSCDWDGTR